MKRIYFWLILGVISFFSCKKEVIQFSLNASASPIKAGTISPESGTYENGQFLNILATPKSEYLFKEWQGDLSGTLNPASVLMDKNKSILGVFERRQYPLNLTIEGSGSIKEEIIAVATDSQYPSGTTVKLTAKANVGSEFDSWTGDVNSRDSSITIIVKNTINLIAKFKVSPPIVPAVNTEILPNINWNDHASGKNAPYDINNDGIPDIVSYESMTNRNKNPAIVKILDYNGKTILNFDIKDYKKNIRDSLGNVLIDFSDLNNDGYLDLGLSYMAEWWNGTPGEPGSYAKYIGNNIFLLLSKKSFNYDVIEVLDAPNDPIQFNINIADWDSDGLLDVLYSIYWRGRYLKNLGGNVFEKRILNPRFNQGISNKVDFDKDGSVDYINLFIKEKDENGNLLPGNEKSQVLTIMTSKGILNFDVIGKTLEKYIYMKKGITSCERISVIDGDNDGDMDLVVGGVKVSNEGNWTYFQEYFENNGFQFIFKENYIEFESNLIGELQTWVLDIDRDGDSDLFYPTYRKSILNTKGNQYFWWENTGKGFKINKKFKLIY